MKMEISVSCKCGNSFSFEDNLSAGRLSHPVFCSNCGQDCTAAANELISSHLNGISSAPPAANPDEGWHSFSNPRRAGLDTKPLPVSPTPAARTVAPITSAANSIQTETETGEETATNRVALAGVAALLAGLLGAFGWLCVAKLTGYEIGYLAWGLGALVGWTSRWVAPRDTSFWV